MGSIAKKKCFIKYALLACAIAFINVYFRQSFIVSFVVAIGEIFTLLFCVLTKRMDSYLCFYLVFLSNCLEFSSFVGDEAFYGFKNFRIVGISLSTLALIPLIAYGLFEITKLKAIEKVNRLKFSSFLLLMNFIAIFIGLFSVLINDNNVVSLGSVFSLLIDDIYEMMFIPLALCVSVPAFLNKNRFFKIKFGIVLETILVGSVFQIIISVIFKQYGYYGGVATLQASTISFFIPFLALSILKQEYSVYPKFCFALSIRGSILLVLFNASGKAILVVAIIYFFLFVRLFCRFKAIGRCLLIIVASAVFVSFIILVNNYSNSSSVIFKSKMNQALSLFNVLDPNWLEKMPISPRTRIEETRSILIEYYHKPYFLFFGKGFLGSITDNTGFFYSHISSADGFVSELEWRQGIFYNLHESNLILIKYGLFGIGFLIYVVIQGLKRFRKTNSLFALIGVFWFLFFYGYSAVISVFGLSSLLFGYYYSYLSNCRQSEKQLLFSKNIKPILDRSSI